MRAASVLCGTASLVLVLSQVRVQCSALVLASCSSRRRRRLGRGRPVGFMPTKPATYTRMEGEEEERTKERDQVE